ncbi:MAG: phage holin family protein [Thermoleophilia bacterium]|jgi:putative membrane protein
MRGLLTRWAITAAAVAVAAWLVPGIYVEEPHRIWTVVLVALVLGLVNALIRPFVSVLTCGLTVLTLGLFTLVINALMLWLASWIAAEGLGLGFHVDGFWNALLGSIIISIVSFIASTFVRDRHSRRR